MNEQRARDTARGADASARALRAFERAADRAVREADARIALCHERVACPTCGAPVGKRCRSMPRGYRPMDLPGQGARVLAHSHKRRWTLVVPDR